MYRFDIMPHIISLLRKHPRIVELIKEVANKVSPETVALLDYPVCSRQRWDINNPHQDIYEILNRNRNAYRSCLQEFLRFSSNFVGISPTRTDNLPSSEPYWVNGWIPALDGVALYSFLAIHKPNIFMEIGSGNSTKFARKAIVDHNLSTQIVSIDPCPRVDVDKLCDKIIRKPVEEIDINIFESLKANDILFVDNSHRVFMNSDATAIFIDIIPRLNPGVLVEIHDVTLPYDYPADWVSRYYSEQYLLAAYLLAKGNMFDIILPNYFISFDNEMKSILNPLWEKEEMKNVKLHGCSFWMRIK